MNAVAQDRFPRRPWKVRVILLGVCGAAVVAITVLVALCTISREVTVRMPSSAKPHNLRLRIPYWCKLEEDLTDPNVDPRLLRFRLRGTLERGGTVAGLYDRWLLHFGTGAAPGLVVVYYFPNKEGVPLDQFVRNWSFTLKRPTSDALVVLPSLHGTERIMRRLQTQFGTEEHLWLWRPGYGGLCALTSFADRDKPRRVLHEQPRILRSAYLEPAGRP